MVIKFKFETRTHHFDNKKMLLDARQSSWAYLVVEAVISAEWCEVNYANVDFIEVTWGGAAAAEVKNRCVAITIFCRLWRGDQQDTKIRKAPPHQNNISATNRTLRLIHMVFVGARRKPDF
jgi:hypothetical protein